MGGTALDWSSGSGDVATTAEVVMVIFDFGATAI